MSPPAVVGSCVKRSSRDASNGPEAQKTQQNFTQLDAMSCSAMPCNAMPCSATSQSFCSVSCRGSCPRGDAAAGQTSTDANNFGPLQLHTSVAPSVSDSGGWCWCPQWRRYIHCDSKSMWDPLRAVYSKWDDAGNVQDSIIPDVHINPEALICAQADPDGGLAEER